MAKAKDKIREGTLTRIPKLTLTDLIRNFMEYAAEEGRKSFPPLHTSGTRPWHLFLYELSKRKKDFPVLECIGEFDWDGPTPKAKGWGDVANAIAITDACSLRTRGLRSYLCGDRQITDNILAINYPELAEEMFKLALTIEGFFKKLDVKA